MRLPATDLQSVPRARRPARVFVGVGALLAVVAAGVSVGTRGAESVESTPAAIYARSAPGVVDIRVSAIVQGPLGPERVAREGSGFVLDKGGEVVTAEHVVADAAWIDVRFQSGVKARAAVVSRSVALDLALLRVRVARSVLHPLPLGTASVVRPGDPVVAIGSVLGYPRSVTAGIVSAVGRTIRARNGSPIRGAIQSDVAIGAGSSGGPLLDDRGYVIGVNVQLGDGSIGFQGVGFAVTVDALRTLTRAA